MGWWLEEAAAAAVLGEVLEVFGFPSLPFSLFFLSLDLFYVFRGFLERVLEEIGSGDVWWLVGQRATAGRWLGAWWLWFSLSLSSFSPFLSLALSFSL